jgi:tetratricopeptide (TPR) repeat protein
MAALRDTAWQAYYRKDFVTAVETFGTMLSDEPDNLTTLRGLMYSAYRMQDYDKALSLANRIASTEDTRFTPEAMLLIGDIHWLKNEHEKAMDAYVSIETEYETFEQRRIKRIAALSYPDIVRSQPNGAMREERSLRELLRDVLVASKPVSEKMALLSVCMQAAPESWLPYFLTGELLHKEKAWQISNEYFHQALKLLIPRAHGKLILEVQRLIGINAYQQKDYETAQNAFRSIAENTALPLGEVLSAQNWIQRCQWAESQ